jgi:hypothetical protein
MLAASSLVPHPNFHSPQYLALWKEQNKHGTRRPLEVHTGFRVATPCDIGCISLVPDQACLLHAYRITS